VSCCAADATGTGGRGPPHVDWEGKVTPDCAFRRGGGSAGESRASEVVQLPLSKVVAVGCPQAGKNTALRKGPMRATRNSARTCRKPREVIKSETRHSSASVRGPRRHHRTPGSAVFKVAFPTTRSTWALMTLRSASVATRMAGPYHRQPGHRSQVGPARQSTGAMLHPDGP
jgi:hypothetical protein